MKPFWATHYLLPGQEHPEAQAVGDALELAREQIAGLVGCDSFELVFTSGGTEANNLAILGGLDLRQPGHVLISPLESDPVVAAAEHLSGHGFEVETMPVGPDGTVDPDDVVDALRSDTHLVCVQLANPTLGTIQPVAEIGRRCRERGVRLHCDATQSLGKIPVSIHSMPVDTLAISGHKFFGPKGVGAIYIRRGQPLHPIQHGEPREMGLRPGSENVPGCVGMGAAAVMATRCAAEAELGLKDMRDELLCGLASVIDPPPTVLCEDTPRLPNTAAIELPVDVACLRQAARQLVVATARSESPPDEMTRALQAIGRNPPQIGRTVHISLGWATTRDEVRKAIDLFADAFETTRS